MLQATIDHPDGIIQDTLYPIVHFSTIRDIIKDLSKNNRGYKGKIYIKMHASYRGHYRTAICDILTIIQQLEERDIQFVSLKEQIDTRTSNGKAMFQKMCVIAELERNLIAERVKEGLEASKKRVKKLGRPKVDKDKISLALRMYDSKEYSIK
ncbi:recombinase family protein [Bacillus cereus]|uniref:recombinase family protein n=1 Tax=Bacillus cereus TaxID=1396 RepID=UPI0039C86E4D